MNLEQAINSISPLDAVAMEQVRQHWLDVAKPLFSLGRLEDIVTQIGGIRGSSYFNLNKKALIIMCADNGVVAEGVTQSTQNITATVTQNFVTGQTGAAIMSEIAGVDLFPIDIGVSKDVVGVTDRSVKLAYGTNNMTKGPAMTKEMTIKAVEIGINKVLELKEKGYSIIATGEMGIGNTTTSSAVLSVLTNNRVEDITGRGAGLTSAGLDRKIKSIKEAIAVNQPDSRDVIDVLSKVGGLDIAGLMGVFIGGAVGRVPVIIDGFISSVAALCAMKYAPLTREYMIASHLSKETAAAIVLDELDMSPIVCADMCLGEGTGALTIIPLLDMALSVYLKLHTFQNWNGDETYTVLK